MGNPENAQTKAKGKAKANPKAAQVCLAKGSQYHLEGKYELSLHEYEKALEFYQKLSKNAAYHLNVGVVFYDDGQLQNSFDCFKKSLSIKPNNALAHCNVGNVLKMQGKIEAALEEYRISYELSEEALAQADSKKDASNAAVERNSWNGLVGCFISLDRLEEALEETNTKLLKTSDNLEALCLKILVLVKLKREDSIECELAVRKVLQHYFQSQDRVNSHIDNQSKGDIKSTFNFDLDDEKRHLFGFVLSKCALSRKRHNDRGRNNKECKVQNEQIQSQRDSGTLQLWQLACTMEPSYSNLIHLGAEYERLKDLESARNAYLTARKVAPENWGSHYRLGKLGFKRHKFSYASKHLESAVILAEAAVSSATGDKAKTHALSVVSQLQLNLGIVLINAHKLDFAKRHLALAGACNTNIEGNKTNTVIAKSLLAMVQIKEGKIDNALYTLVQTREHLKRISNKVPSVSEIHFCTAVLSQNLRMRNANEESYNQEGKQEYQISYEIECLQAALKADPSHNGAKTQLDKLMLVASQAQSQNDSGAAKSLDNITSRLDLSNKVWCDVEEFKNIKNAFESIAVKENSKRCTEASFKQAAKTKPELHRKPVLTRMKSCPLPNTETSSKDTFSSEKNRNRFLHSLKLRRSAISGDEASDDDAHDDLSEDSEDF